LRNNSRESSIETKRTCSKEEIAELAKNKNIIGFDNTLDKYLYTTVEYKMNTSISFHN
jgi:hypothetical protein